MDKIEENGRRLCYFDTDSVQYLEKAGDPKIPTGDYLGDLTDEVLGMTGDKDARIKRALWLGPKNYAYEIHKSDGSKILEIKSKGITLHAAALTSLRFEDLAERVKQFGADLSQDPIIAQQHRLRTDPNTHLIYAETFKKNIRVTLSKRWYYKDGEMTLPYGYKENSSHFDRRYKGTLAQFAEREEALRLHELEINDRIFDFIRCITFIMK